MVQFASDISIDALPKRVWDVLTDFGRYTEWNPLFVSAEGSVINGSRIRLTHKPPFLRDVQLGGRIVQLEPERKLAFQTGMVIPGLYRCESEFRLEVADGLVRVHHRQSYGGLMVAMIAGANGIKFQEGCYTLNLAIKRRSEDKDWKLWPRARG